MRKKNHQKVNLLEPSKEEFLKCADAGKCWWCNDGKVYKILSLHFSTGHGIDPLELRNQFLLPRAYAFASQEIREKCRATGKETVKRYPDSLKIGHRFSQVVSNYGKLIRCKPLTLSDILEIRELLAKGVFQKTIAKQFGVHKETISRISRGKRWDWVR